MTTTTLGQRIRHYRKRLGLTQAELHKRMEESPKGCSFLSMVESGTRNVTPQELVSLAEIFGITTDELLGVKEHMPFNTDIILQQLIKTELLLKETTEDRAKLCQQLSEVVLADKDNKIFTHRASGAYYGNKTEAIYSAVVDGETYRIIATLDVETQQTQTEIIEDGKPKTINVGKPIVAGIEVTEVEICKVSKLF